LRAPGLRALTRRNQKEGFLLQADMGSRYDAD